MYYKGKETRLRRSIDAKSLTFFGLANILGPQIFVMLSGLILFSGEYGIFSLIICYLICLGISFIFSELAMSMPIASLIVNSVNDSLGGFFAFLVGWAQLFGNISFVAVCALSFGLFTGFPVVGAIIAVIGSMLLQLKGLEDVGKLEKILVSFVLGFFLLLIIFNSGNLLSLGSVSFVPGIAAVRKIVYGAGFIFLAFTGFEDLTTYSEEVKDVKNLPYIIMLSLTIVSVIFLLLYLTLMGGMSAENILIMEEPLKALSMNIFGSFAGMVLSLVGIIASLTSLLSSSGTCTRNVMAMAEKGFLPTNLLYVNEDVPVYAVYFSTVLTVVLLLIRGLEIIIHLANFLYFFNVFFITLAAIQLRKRRSKLERPFKIPFFPIIPWIVAIAMVVLILFLRPEALALGISWILTGFIIYMLKIVGDKRLKIALLGGSIFCTMIFMVLWIGTISVSGIGILRFGFLLIIALCIALFLWLVNNLDNTDLFSDEERS